MLTTAELLDLTPLVSGWYRPEVESADPDEVTTDTPSTHDPDESPDCVSLESAVKAIDIVLSRYPLAAWKVTGDTGRIVAGGRLVSLAFPLVDEWAEMRAWVDCVQRLGDGNQWTGIEREEKRIKVANVIGPGAVPRFNQMERGRAARAT